MTENGLFVLGGPETQLHDILWAVHDGKNRGKRGGGKFRGVPGYGGRSGAERCALLSYASTRMTTLRTLRPGGSRLSGTSFRAKI